MKKIIKWLNILRKNQKIKWEEVNTERQKEKLTKDITKILRKLVIISTTHKLMKEIPLSKTAEAIKQGYSNGGQLFLTRNGLIEKVFDYMYKGLKEERYIIEKRDFVKFIDRYKPEKEELLKVLEAIRS